MKSLMMKSLVTLSVALFAILASFAASASPRDRALIGSVSRIDGDQLLVCFRKTSPPEVGVSLDIRRGSIPYKSSGATVYRTIGHARVTAVADDKQCVNAELKDGRPYRFDRAQPSASGST